MLLPRAPRVVVCLRTVLMGLRKPRRRGHVPPRMRIRWMQQHACGSRQSSRREQPHWLHCELRSGLPMLQRRQQRNLKTHARQQQRGRRLSE